MLKGYTARPDTGLEINAGLDTGPIQSHAVAVPEPYFRGNLQSTSHHSHDERPETMRDQEGVLGFLYGSLD